MDCSTQRVLNPEVRQQEFWHWLGWSGLEEDVEPYEKNERFWLIRVPTV